MENRDQGAQISVRRIDNGYVMTYYEAVEVEVAGGAWKVYRPEPREVFFDNPEDGGVAMAKAIMHADRLVEGLENLDRARTGQPQDPEKVT